MKFLSKTIAALPVALALASVIPASAQSMSQTTVTTRTTTTTPYYHRVWSDSNDEAIDLHNRAVDLAHQATYAAQHGNRREATRLAAQAQELFNRAFTLSQQSLR